MNQRSDANMQNINVNNSYSGKMTSYRDVGQYKFVLLAAGKINITFRQEEISRESQIYHIWKIQILNVYQEAVLEMYAAAEGAEKTSGDVCLEPGKYFLRIENDSFGVNDVFDGLFCCCSIIYTFQINYTPANCWSIESNDSFGSAGHVMSDADFGWPDHYGNRES